MAGVSRLKPSSVFVDIQAELRYNILAFFTGRIVLVKTCINACIKWRKAPNYGVRSSVGRQIGNIDSGLLQVFTTVDMFFPSFRFAAAQLLLLLLRLENGTRWIRLAKRREGRPGASIKFRRELQTCCIVQCTKD
ncbi:unnamed protein product [Calypogeia fissa]